MSTAVDTLPRYTSQYGRWAPLELAKLAFVPGYIVSISEPYETLSWKNNVGGVDVGAT